MKKQYSSVEKAEYQYQILVNKAVNILSKNKPNNDHYKRLDKKIHEAWQNMDNARRGINKEKLPNRTY